MSSATVDEAIDLALDVYIDTVTGGTDLNAAFNAIAVNALDFAGDQPVDFLGDDCAVLDDGTRLGLRPTWEPVSARLRLSHMLGFTSRLKHLPPCIETVETVEGSVLHTWPMLGLNVLRGFFDYTPVLTRADGTRVFSPHDATRTDGLLIVTPSISLAFNTGRVVVDDLGLA